MHALFKHSLLIASAACLQISPVFAADKGRDARPANVAEWVKQVNLKLYRSMVTRDTLTGLAIVTFRRGVDGYPIAVTVHDAPRPIERAARETLRRAHRLPPLPAGVDPDQLIKVQLLFAGDGDMETYVARRHALLTSADAMNRRFDVAMAAGTRVASAR